MGEWDSREVRQQFYQSNEWQNMRLYILSNEPFCRKCKAEGYLVGAKIVDHIIDIADDPSKRLDPNNLQPMCQKCHSSKTLTKMNKIENKPNENRKKERTFKIMNRKWKI
jgi:5-methylcytosine-specific restriction endonuclease McrA